MNKARTEKVAVVDELKERVDSTSTAVVTEYRGMTSRSTRTPSSVALLPEPPLSPSTNTSLAQPP